MELEPAVEGVSAAVVNDARLEQIRQASATIQKEPDGWRLAEGEFSGLRVLYFKRLWRAWLPRRFRREPSMELRVLDAVGRMTNPNKGSFITNETALTRGYGSTLSGSSSSDLVARDFFLRDGADGATARTLVIAVPPPDSARIYRQLRRDAFKAPP